MSLNWNGEQAQAAIERMMSRRIGQACGYLEKVVKADISQTGTLRYHPLTKKGKRSKTAKTIYNFTHSVPGNPPYKQTGHLRRSITHEVSKLIGRVGTNLLYGRYLELGTRRMAARPYLRRALIQTTFTLRRIIGGTIRPGELPAIRSNQYRSGVLGAGARKAGY